MSATDEEVRAVLDQMVDALNAGDREGVLSLLSERLDAVHIGTDPNEWSTTEEFLASLSGAQSELRARLDQVGVHSLGDVAWVEAKGHFSNSSGGERRVRVTGVLVREDGRWKVAQQHASIGVPNTEIFR